MREEVIIILMKALNYNQIQFLKSAAEIHQLPDDLGAEVAFAGRSNAGKSSAINAITGIHRLAKTSKTPGRTQLINFFALNEQLRLVDLPGYGFAKVSESIKNHWKQLLDRYFNERQSLKGVILLMDIRHPLKDQDWQMIEWSMSHSLPMHILLTKADKLSRGAAHSTLFKLRKELSGYEELITIQLFSVPSSIGIEEVHATLDKWLDIQETL